MEKFHPFSVLDTRTKKWKDNEQWWIDKYNIKSEIGREDIKSKAGFWETPDYTSVFSPTLSQVMYKWFCPKGGTILDPFAGGSVRGIVAEELGYSYTGIELSEKQVEANKLQSNKPRWIVGDSQTVLNSVPNESFDFVFTCPPYHDLEVYSDDPKDLSNMPYQRFLGSLNSILYKSQEKLKDNRFFGIVVSEIRDLGKTRDYKIGKYRNFVSSVIEMCEESGLHFYNDMVLFNSQHQASRTGGTYFKRNRKIPSVHQNILIFVKGNPDLATEIIECNGNFVCTVDGNNYRSFREAAISIDPTNLIGSEVKRRCESTKSKYKEYQIFGEQTNPDIKYVIDGVPFEDIPQINEKTGIIESEIYNKITSNNPITRHWRKIIDIDFLDDISYSRMKFLQDNSKIRTKLPIISCEGIRFFSTYEAGTHFGLSKERIRQKLKDSKFTDYFELY